MRNYCFIFFCFLPAFLFAQEEEDVSLFMGKQKWEIGVNATSVISNFIGNTNDDVLTPGDYPFAVKRLFKQGNQALRIGLGAQYVAKKQTFDTPLGDLINYDNEIHARVGWEWRKVLAKRWMTNAGVDISGFWMQNTSHTTANGDLTSLSKLQAGGGGGPVLGFQFAFSKRIHLGCEASLYTSIFQKHQSLKFLNNPDENEISTTYEYNFAMSAPKWLYVIVRF